MFNKHTIPLFGKVVTPVLGAYGLPAVDERHVQMFTAEVSSLGYTLAGVNKLKELDSSTFFSFRHEVLEVLGEAAKIPNVKVLFNKFPYETPNQVDYLIRRIVGYIGQQRMKGHFLSCGHVIDERLFNADDFGVCPICQFSVDELSTPLQATNHFENISPLKSLELISAYGALNLAEQLLGRNSSLSAQEKAFLAFALSINPNLTLPAKCFKETLPFVYHHTKNVEYVKAQLSGATDVLRIASYVSDPENADLSLAENTKFRFTAAHIKDFLSLLDGLSNLEEDFMRHPDRWKRIGHLLHPTKAKNVKKYPNVAMAFETLSNNSKSINTFNRQVERNIDDTPSLAKILATRPGEFGRRVDLLLRNSKSEQIADIVAQFEKLAPKLTIKMLFELNSHLCYRMDRGDTRLFFIKGANKYYHKPEDRPSLDYEHTAKIIGIIDRTLQKRLANKADLGKVFVDPNLYGRIVPFNTRGDSNKSEAMLAKGSRYPFTGDVIRLYVWWKGHIDVDLSGSFYDEEWNYVDHIGFTNLKNNYAIHSGDIQNAPNGATEFLDIDISGALANAKGARYAVSSIISYRGDTFDTFPCFAGFMERDSLKSGQLFEPESVVTKVDINSKSSSQMMFAFDLHTREVILMDMQAGKSRYGVHSSGVKFKAIAKNIVDLPRRKPSYYDVLFTYGSANGKIVFEKEKADTVFDYDVDTQYIHDILANT